MVFLVVSFHSFFILCLCGRFVYTHTNTAERRINRINKMRHMHERTDTIPTGDSFVDVIWHQNDTLTASREFLILLSPSQSRRVLTFALIAANGFPLSFHVSSGFGLPISLHSNFMAWPTRTITLDSGDVNSGRVRIVVTPAAKENRYTHSMEIENNLIYRRCHVGILDMKKKTNKTRTLNKCFNILDFV